MRQDLAIQKDYTKKHITRPDPFPFLLHLKTEVSLGFSLNTDSVLPDRSLPASVLVRIVPWYPAGLL
jgi:hypothetical protein